MQRELRRLFGLGETYRPGAGQLATLSPGRPPTPSETLRRRTEMPLRAKSITGLTKVKRAKGSLARQLQCSNSMSDPATPHAENDPPNLGSLLEDALHQAKNLVQAELSLARNELKGELKAVYETLLFLGLSAFFLQAALVSGSVLVVMSLGAGALAAAVVLAFVLVGVMFLLLAWRALAKKKLPRTMARLTADATQILETAK